MSRRALLLLLLLLLALVLHACASPGDAPAAGFRRASDAEFTELVAQAERDARIPGAYEVQQSVQAQIERGVPECLMSAPGAGLRYDLVLVLGADGRLADLVSAPSYPDDPCVARAFRRAQYLVPPAAPFRIHAMLHPHGEKPDKRYGTPPPAPPLKLIDPTLHCEHLQPQKEIRRVQPAPSLGGGHHKGEAWVVCRLGVDGKPYECSVKSASDRAFGDATAAAVRQWRYEPALCDGRPVEVMLEVRATYAD